MADDKRNQEHPPGSRLDRASGRATRCMGVISTAVVRDGHMTAADRRWAVRSFAPKWTGSGICRSSCSFGAPAVFLSANAHFHRSRTANRERAEMRSRPMFDGGNPQDDFSGGGFVRFK